MFGKSFYMHKYLYMFVEEILHRAEAIWMSSDGHMMLYASFNDSLVDEMHISWFGEGYKALYPHIRSLRYPKVILFSFIILD